MTDHEPTPIERTQLIEFALSSYKSDSPNLIEMSHLDHNLRKIESEMGHDAVVKPYIDELRNSIAELKNARTTKSYEEEKTAVQSATAANLRLRRAIAEKGG